MNGGGLHEEILQKPQTFRLSPSKSRTKVRNYQGTNHSYRQKSLVEILSLMYINCSTLKPPSINAMPFQYQQYILHCIVIQGMAGSINSTLLQKSSPSHHLKSPTSCPHFHLPTAFQCTPTTSLLDERSPSLRYSCPRCH